MKIDKDTIINTLAFAEGRPLMTRIVAVNFKKEGYELSSKIVAWLSTLASNSWEDYSKMLDEMNFPFTLTVGHFYEICQPSEERLDEWEKEMKEHKKVLRPMLRKEFDRIVKQEDAKESFASDQNSQ